MDLRLAFGEGFRFYRRRAVSTFSRSPGLRPFLMRTPARGARPTPDHDCQSASPDLRRTANANVSTAIAFHQSGARKRGWRTDPQPRDESDDCDRRRTAGTNHWGYAGRQKAAGNGSAGALRLAYELERWRASRVSAADALARMMKGRCRCGGSDHLAVGGTFLPAWDSPVNHGLVSGAAALRGAPPSTGFYSSRGGRAGDRRASLVEGMSFSGNLATGLRGSEIRRAFLGLRCGQGREWLRWCGRAARSSMTWPSKTGA